MMRISTLLAMTLVFGTLGACQGEKAGSPAPAASSAPSTLSTQEVSVTGENFCLGCSLKKEQGAKAQCSTYGHRHALRVETATGKDGSGLPSLKGQTLHYLENDQSAPLSKDEAFHKKRVEIKGKLFASERTLDVGEVKAL